MLYNPSAGISPLFLELRTLLSAGLVQAGLVAAGDFAQRAPKPWQYYAGVLGGATVAATGSPLASLAFYTTAAAADLLLFKSPQGEGFSVFVDGVALGSVASYAASEVWDRILLTFGTKPAGERRRVEFRTHEDDNGDGYNWFALGGILPLAGALLLPRDDYPEGVPWQVSLSLHDYAQRRASLQFYYPYFADFYEVERYAREFVRRLALCIDGAVDNVVISRRADVDYVEQDGSASVYSKATFVLSDGAAPRGRLSVPTWNEALVRTLRLAKPPRVPDGDNPQVAAFKGMLVNAIGEGYLANPCDARGKVINTIHRSTRYAVKA